jgi:hypothetical protein
LKSHSRHGVPRLFTGLTWLLLASLLGGAAARAAAPPARKSVLTCTNPYSHASWPIHIDYAHRTVDGNSATVTPERISWRGARDGGHYSLDLKTGSLTVIFASSTGGYALHYVCR